jgi:hypothetical protein
VEFLRGSADWGEVEREHELGSEGERGGGGAMPACEHEAGGTWIFAEPSEMIIKDGR